MANRKQNTKKYIVSCRVDDYEMTMLKQRAHKDGVSITQLLRNCLDFAEAETRRQTPNTERYACG